MKGTHWQPLPGYAGDHTPVGIADDGSRPDRGQDDSDDVEYKPVPIDEDHAKGLEPTKASKPKFAYRIPTLASMARRRDAAPAST